VTIEAAIYDHMSVMHGLRRGEFQKMDKDQKTLVLRMIARACEQSFRRGFQQGWDSRDRGDKVCDLHKWRFSTSLGISPSAHDTYHCTSLERLKIECGLYQVGLPRMEESYLTSSDVQTYIAPLFARHRKKSGVKKSLRFSVLRRDGFRCVYCGATAKEQKLHVDHVYPKSMGGTDDESNLVTSCEPCNLGKSNKHVGVVVNTEAPHGR
jgi:hypothetical protein